MKLRILSCAAVLLVASTFAADLKPADSGTPLFRIFQALPKDEQKKSGPPQLTFDPKHPLLVVWSVRDLKIGPDHKSVLLVLTEKDRKIFAALTHKYNHSLLLLEAQGDVLEAIQITQPLENGVLEFSYPDDAATAQYLRRRFKLGEFR
jgi:hypothetical protein